MVFRVCSTSNIFVSPFEICILSKTALRISQVALGLLTTLCAGVLLEGCISTSLPPWVYPVSGAAIGLSLLGGAATLYFKPMTSVAKKAPLLSAEEISSLNLTSQVHELCEMSPNGTHIPCSIERLKAIIAQLKSKSALHALNTIPEYYLSKSRFPRPSTFYTPLQYWASQGNLPAVQLLVEHGAVDYLDPIEGVDSGQMTTALYEAVLGGHSSIVSYLLRHGAQGTIAFNQNLLASFIPKLIFQFHQKVASCPLITPERQSPFEGLKQVLQHLSSHQPSNLRLQLRIPIAPEKNSVDWAEALDPRSPERRQLLQILTRFGGVRNDVVSYEELERLGNIGPGLTLQEFALRKN